MNKFLVLVLFLTISFGNFNGNSIEARKPYRRPDAPRIHRPLETWRKEYDDESRGGSSLSPWELNLISEILLEFGISACPAIETSDFDEFDQYLSGPISQAHDRRIPNDRFIEVYDILTYCLESVPRRTNGEDYQNQESDGSQQTSEHGEESKVDASDALASSHGSKSPPLPIPSKKPLLATSKHFVDDTGFDGLSQVVSDSSTPDKDSSATPTKPQSPAEVGRTETLRQIGKEIYEKARELLTWFEGELRGLLEYAFSESMSKSYNEDSPPENPDSVSKTDQVTPKVDEVHVEVPSRPSYYHFQKVPSTGLRQIVGATKSHFSDVFQHSTLIALNKCPAVQRHINFIQDAAFKILNLVYDDLENAAQHDEVLIVNTELHSRLKNCTK